MRGVQSYRIAGCDPRRVLCLFRMDRLELIHDESLDTDR